MVTINNEEYSVGVHEIDGQMVQVIDKSTYITLPQKHYPSRVQESLKDDSLININTADADELILLNGVGKAGAERIIAHRPYLEIDDLTKVGGINQKIIDKNRDLIAL